MDLDDTVENGDWIKSNRWDVRDWTCELALTIPQLLSAMQIDRKTVERQREELAKADREWPSFRAMPAELRQALVAEGLLQPK